jgi:hypothetical protein
LNCRAIGSYCNHGGDRARIQQVFRTQRFTALPGPRSRADRKYFGPIPAVPSGNFARNAR